MLGKRGGLPPTRLLGEKCELDAIADTELGVDRARWFPTVRTLIPKVAAIVPSSVQPVDPKPCSHNHRVPVSLDAHATSFWVPVRVSTDLAEVRSATLHVGDDGVTELRGLDLGGVVGETCEVVGNRPGGDGPL